MKNNDYKETLIYDMFGCKGKGSQLLFFYKKHFQPNTNCVYLARKMWYYYSKGKVGRLLAKWYHMRIFRKYNSWISQEAVIGKGLTIKHPIGIVIGKCKIGDCFTISHNTTVGSVIDSESGNLLAPIIGNNVTIGANCVIQGDVIINDNENITPGTCIVHTTYHKVL